MKIRLLLFPLLLCLGACSDPISSWPNEKFTEAIWSQTPDDERYKFANNLIQRKILDGKNREEVIQILGEPSFEASDGTYIAYILRVGGTGYDFNQVYALDIRFNPETRRVNAVGIRGD